MAAPRQREQRRPPSPPDRRPPRRGGGSSPSTYAASAPAGRPAGPARLRSTRRVLVRSARALAAAALLALSGALALPAQAQEEDPMACTLNTAAGDLWCGVVTVALHTVGGFDVSYGFVDASATTNTFDTGALSDETFSVGSNNYTIDSVTVGRDKCRVLQFQPDERPDRRRQGKAGAARRQPLVRVRRCRVAMIQYDNSSQRWDIVRPRLVLGDVRDAAAARSLQQRPGILRRARGVHRAGEQRRGHRCRHGDGDGRRTTTR